MELAEQGFSGAKANLIQVLFGMRLSHLKVQYSTVALEEAWCFLQDCACSYQLLLQSHFLVLTHSC